tara:strand:- start:1725 stop:1916 length:192 start_codon:yes stop_codon:yes gene_type:complete
MKTLTGLAFLLSLTTVLPAQAGRLSDQAIGAECVAKATQIVAKKGEEGPKKPLAPKQDAKVGR